MTLFSDFGLAAPLLRALEAEGYTSPTPIQQQAIAPVMEGRDLLGIAQTGTGKTAAFALPTLHRLAQNPQPTPAKSCRVLVLSPTRELASQIAESFRAYGSQMRLSVATVFGGMPIGRQQRQMERGVDILVATPGRLLDLIDRRALSLSHVETFVLDEADQMLDLGFIHALKRLVPMLPRRRQSLFFSATMPKSIAELAQRFLHNPVEVAVTPVATTAERVAQTVMFVNQSEKQALLHLVLQNKDIARVLVFTRTKHGADRVVRHLTHAHITAAAIHGNKSQAQRERALDAFRKGDCRVLVATDIAARGIDVEGVSHVINFELPNVPEQYVHRIGRTARAGASGEALAFCAPDERAYLRDIEKLTRQKVESVALPQGLAAAVAHMPARLPQSQEEQGRGRGGAGHGRSHGQGHGRSEGYRGAGAGAGAGGGKAAPGRRVARLRSPDVQVHADGPRARRPEGAKKMQGQGQGGNVRRAR